MPSEKTSAAGRSLIDAATRTNQANPDAAVSTRLIHANQANGGRTVRRRARSRLRKGWFGDEDNKEHDTRHHQRRCEMDRTNVDQRVIQSVLLARAFRGRCLSAADTEGEASLRRVGVNREHVPMDAIGSCCKRLEPDAHDAAADLRLALIDPRAV